MLAINVAVRGSRKSFAQGGHRVGIEKRHGGGAILFRQTLLHPFAPPSPNLRESFGEDGPLQGSVVWAGERLTPGGVGVDDGFSELSPSVVVPR